MLCNCEHLTRFSVYVFFVEDTILDHGEHLVNAHCNVV